MNRAALVSRVIGTYRLVEFLGAGGMGEVYRAVHLRSGQVVAVKVLSNPGHSATFVERFRREAGIQARLQHPNIARFIDFVEFSGRPCIVMEYVDGVTLAEHLRVAGALPVNRALALFRALVEAVAYVHSHGIVHRDLKAGNIKITTRGQVKLLDFGIARGDHARRLTAVGAVVGTPECLAPEQVRGKDADTRSDVWALGVLLYEMVTGRVPFEAPTLDDLYKKIDRVEYAPASVVQQQVPPGVEALITRCLSRRPSDRFASAGALMQVLDAASSRPAAPKRALLPAPERPPVPEPAKPLSLPETLAWTRLGRPWMALALVGVVLVLALALPDLLAWEPKQGPKGKGPGTEQVDEVMREITITVVGSPAQVYRDGALLGTTPVLVQAPIGAPVVVELQRAGYRNKTIRFTMPSSRSTVHEHLEPLR